MSLNNLRLLLKYFFLLILLIGVIFSFLSTRTLEKYNDVQAKLIRAYVTKSKIPIDSSILPYEHPLILELKGLLIAQQSLEDSLYRNYTSRTANENKLALAKKFFLGAHKLQPYDDNFCFNLSWLYFSTGKADSAIQLIDDALKINNFNSIYYVSKGIFLHNQNKILEANIEFENAAFFSPDILYSKFYKEFVRLDFTMINKNLQSRAASFNTTSNIVDAKLAKIFFDRKLYDKAFVLLNNLNIEFPSMNRPWYYKGEIYARYGNIPGYLDCLNKSYMLDPGDVLILKSLGDFYYNKKDYVKSRKYYIELIHSLKIYYSDHSSKCKKLYNLKQTDLDFFPNNLIMELKPDMDTIIINSRLSIIDSLDA